MRTPDGHGRVELTSVRNSSQPDSPPPSPASPSYFDASRPSQAIYREQFAAHYRTAKEFATDGFLRTLFTSSLVDRFVRAVDLSIEDLPQLSRVTMEEEARLEVLVLKHLTYELLINSSRLKLVAQRGTQIVRTIFEILTEDEGPDLLSEEVRQRWDQADVEHQRLRVVCDFIAGMTDRYAVEFYARLTSDDFHTMFKPL